MPSEKSAELRDMNRASSAVLHPARTSFSLPFASSVFAARDTLFFWVSASYAVCASVSAAVASANLQRLRRRTQLRYLIIRTANGPTIPGENPE